MGQDWRSEGRQRLKERREGGSLKLTEGENIIRLHAHKKGPKFAPYKEYKTHYSVGPDQAILTCGVDVRGRGKCWLDGMIAKMEQSSDPGKRKQAENLASREGMVVIASRVDAETGDMGQPKPWYVPKQSDLDVQVQSLLLMSKTTVADHQKGHNIIITMTPAGKIKAYGKVFPKIVYSAPVIDEAATPVPARVLNSLKPLEEYLRAYDEEDQRSAFYGRPRKEEESSEQQTLEEESEGEASEGEAEGEETQEGEESFEDQTEAQEEYSAEEELGEPPFEDAPQEEELSDIPEDDIPPEPEEEEDPAPPPARKQVSKSQTVRRPAPQPARAPAKQTSPPARRTAAAPARRK